MSVIPSSEANTSEQRASEGTVAHWRCEDASQRLASREQTRNIVWLCRAQIRTLGQARDAGLHLIAICANILCRSRRELDLVALIDFVGGRHSLTPLRGERHFSERLTCSECGGQGAFIWLIETPEPAPMFAGLSYLINRWHDPTSSRLIETVARAGSEVVANVTFDASVSHCSGDYFTMQQRHRLIRDSRFKVAKGGRG